MPNLATFSHKVSKSETQPRTKNAKQKQKRAGRSQPDLLAKLRNLHWTFLLLVLVILFFEVVRYRLREVPLERDEGEYAYAGQLMLQGIPPYKLAYNMKLPGTYAAYAVIEAIFGESGGGIHIGLIFLDLMSALFMFALGRKLLGPAPGGFSAITFVLLSASPPMLGLAGHAEKFVIFAAIPGLLALLHAIEKDSGPLLVLSGTLLGLAFLMKQPGIVFGLFGLAYVVWVYWKSLVERPHLFSRAGALLAGIVWPFGLACLILYWAGVFHSFWFWTFSYARAYVARVPFTLGMQILWKQAVDIVPYGGILWLLVLTGLAMLVWTRRQRSEQVFVLGLLMFSFVGVSAGFYFRSHYFVLLLPAAALLSGSAIDSVTEMLRGRQLTPLAVALPAVIFMIAAGQFVARGSRFFFAPSPLVACQRLYANNPFTEAQQIGEFLKLQTPPAARVAVFGSEPEIYFVAHRHSATGYIYTYALMEDQPYATKMQEEMMREVTQASPDYVVFVDDHLSWLWQPGGSREDFFRRIQGLVNTQYVKAAQVDIAGNSDHLLPPVPRIYLFRRKDLQEPIVPRS